MDPQWQCVPTGAAAHCPQAETAAGPSIVADDESAHGVTGHSGGEILSTRLPEEPIFASLSTARGGI